MQLGCVSQPRRTSSTKFFALFNLLKYCVSKNIIIIVIAGIVAIATLLIKNRPMTEEAAAEEVHYHAGFQVYKNDVLQDFSGFEFMKVEPCSIEGHEELDEAHEQLERAHLHDAVGDVVHVHREGATWGDLFQNINVEINPTEVYINGELFEGNFLSGQISPYDSAVIIEGESVDFEDKLQNAVSRDRIVEVEAVSENCAG